MNRFSIRDIENLTGIKAHTIRIWEQRYQILQPKRTATNIRYYDAGDLKLALRIGLLNNYGYKISAIATMTDKDMVELISKVSDDSFRLTAQTDQLLSAALSIDTDHFEELLDRSILGKGLEWTIEHLIFHFLERIGMMWVTDRLFVAQEHLVSHIIYRKLAVAIDALPAPKSTIVHLLFLPEGEVHEIGLLYMHYLMKRQGKKVIYLGANTPLQEVANLYEAKKPESIFLHLTSPAKGFDAFRYLQKLHEKLKDARIYVSGALINGKELPPVSNIHPLRSLEELSAAIRMAG